MRLGNWSITTQIGDPDSVAGAMYVHQTHQGAIVELDSVEVCKTEADGIIVPPGPNVAAIKTADCMPLVITSSNRALLLHVSRKSLVAGLLDAACEFMPAAEITSIWVGPHICERHFSFEWEGSQIKAFKERFPQAVYSTEAATHISLVKAVCSYFRDWNIAQDDVITDGRCTFEESSLPSYRRWLQEAMPAALTYIVTAVRYLPKRRSRDQQSFSS